MRSTSRFALQLKRPYVRSRLSSKWVPSIRDLRPFSGDSKPEEDVNDRLPKSQEIPREATISEVDLFSEKVKRIGVVSLGTFVSCGFLTFLHYSVFEEHSWTLIMGSFASSAMLLQITPESEFARPRNVILGHTISAGCGVLANKFIAVPMDSMMCAIPFACAGAAVAMMSTNNLHPPAGGTALMTCTATGALENMGFEAMIPTAFGASMLVLSSTALRQVMERVGNSKKKP